MNSTGNLTEDILIPQLLQEAPQVRPILDRYGLRGCGGPLGPRETLGFFAKAHDVPIERLLAEIRAGAAGPAVLEATPGRTADTIYRRFFKAGITMVLTLGAAWGAYLLLRIGFTGEGFGAVGVHEVNAHGHAQIFGWVGLFVLGFAYQAFPRFKHTDLAFPRLAFATWWLMLAGILCRSVFEPLIEGIDWAWLPALAGSGLEVIAAVLFTFVIGVTWWRSGKRLAVYDYFIASSLFWFVAQAIYEALYLCALAGAPGREEMLALVKTWQGPLREIQIHGFALLMILGVSQRLLHHMFDFPAPSPHVAGQALIALNLAVLGEVLGLVLMGTIGRGFVLLWYLSVLVLAGSVCYLVKDWKIFGGGKPAGERSLKFLRTAYVWLFISLAMLVLVPVYQRVILPVLAPESGAVQLGFSHAYYGAIRHAITVGFISLMIMGVAAKVVPTLNGVAPAALPSLWGPFLLVNAGCGLRVAGQTLTDFLPASFAITGLSGLLEVAGLFWWGLHLWRIMSGRFPSPGTEQPAATPLLRGDLIQAAHRVGDVLDVYPELLPVFLDLGFKLLANPIFRKTVARRVNLATACRTMGVELSDVLETLNRQRERLAAGRVGLPVIS
jgi:hypothetical protein